MTIAACCMSAEGVVLGADSTTTVAMPGGQHHYFNFAQKVFEIGVESQLGLATWGVGGLMGLSIRTLVARLADDLKAKPPASVRDVADRWAAVWWSSLLASPPHRQSRDEAIALLAAKAAGTALTEEQQGKLDAAQRFGGGFCVGGCTADRAPAASAVTYQLLSAAPVVSDLRVGDLMFYGSPNIVERLVHGVDTRLLDDIIKSKHWKGSKSDLQTLVQKVSLQAPVPALPLRDAIDWVYSSIFATIKALKFSHLAPICGGPIELAVITSDRPFRWVRHKAFDAAIRGDT